MSKHRLNSFVQIGGMKLKKEFFIYECVFYARKMSDVITALPSGKATIPGAP